MTMTHDFDGITLEQLRRTGGMKWSRFGGDVIGAFVAEMDFGTAPCVTSALHAAVDTMNFGYLPASMSQAMSEACAQWQNTVYGWSVAPEQIHPLPDVIRGLQAAIEHFSTPDSAIVLPTPAYMPFFFVPTLMGRDIIEVPMVETTDGRLDLDLAGIGRALTDGGNLVVLCNPHNPCGRVYEPGELRALAAVVDAHGGRVFADEIHAPLVYGPSVHVPYASVSDTAAGHAITATSASKAWNLPGLKCAQLIISNDRDAERWEEVGMMASHGASNLGVVANTAAFAEGRPWLEEIMGYLDGNRHRLAELIDRHLPGVRYTPPQGTYLAWLDCRALDLGDHPGDRFRDETEVALVDGSMCGGPGHVRLNFATPRPILDQMLERMGRLVAA